jgi:uncharacterized repeat protein (TIGR01451 family)
VTVAVTNAPQQTNASCAGDPVAFTNAAGNVAVSNVTNAVGNSCVTVETLTLAVTKTPSATNVITGDPLSFTITVVNNGLASADGTTLTDPPIGGFQASTIACTNAINGAVCPPAGTVTIGNLQGAGIGLPTLPGGGAITFQLGGTFTLSVGTLVNTAIATPPAGIPVQAATGTASVAVIAPVNVPIPAMNAYALLAVMLMLAVLGGVAAGRRARR